MLFDMIRQGLSHNACMNIEDKFDEWTNSRNVIVDQPDGKRFLSFSSKWYCTRKYKCSIIINVLVLSISENICVGNFIYHLHKFYRSLDFVSFFCHV